MEGEPLARRRRKKISICALILMISFGFLTFQDRFSLRFGRLRRPKSRFFAQNLRIPQNRSQILRSGYHPPTPRGGAKDQRLSLSQDPYVLGALCVRRSVLFVVSLCLLLPCFFPFSFCFLLVVFSFYPLFALISGRASPDPPPSRDVILCHCLSFFRPSAEPPSPSPKK